MEIKDDWIYDVKGYKDYFGNPMIVRVNEIEHAIRLLGKNKEYKRQRSNLDKRGLRHVIIPEWLEVIDVSKATYNKLQKRFNGYKHTEWNVWED